MTTPAFNRDQQPDPWRHSRRVAAGDGVRAGAVGTERSDLDAGGTGDLNSDGKADLVWHNLTSHYVAVWLMTDVDAATKGTQLLDSLLTSRAINANDWKIVGVGDYNRDGKPDLIWRDTTPGGAGWIGIWLMNGTTLQSSVATNPENYPLAWRIVGPK